MSRPHDQFDINHKGRVKNIGIRLQGGGDYKCNYTHSQCVALSILHGCNIRVLAYRSYDPDIREQLLISIKSSLAPF